MELNIYLLDKYNNIIEEANIKKPHSYDDLLNSITNNFKQLPDNYYIFYSSGNNKEMQIKNNEDYILVNDMIFIKNSEKTNILESIYEENYNQLSQSKRDILDENYSCFICTENIKNEKPLFCYKCQKIYHQQCLKYWEDKRKEKNLNLNCPNCRNELPLKEWKLKLDYEDNRKNIAQILNKLNKYKKNLKYTKNILKNIFVKIYSINLLFNKTKLNNLKNKLLTEDDDIKDISDTIFEGLKIIENYIKNQTNNINNKQLNQALTQMKNNNNIDNDNVNKNKIFDNKNYKKEINLIYVAKDRGTETIFGNNFVERNKNNIELIINGKNNPLTED